MTAPDEQMIANIAKAIARASIEAAEPQTGRLSDAGIEQLAEHFALRCYPEARAAHSVMAGKVAEMEALIRPFAAASALFTSAVHYGGIEAVRDFPTPEEWRKLSGLFPGEFGGAVRKRPGELRAALAHPKGME